jgi:hypothetical protein
MALLQMLYGIVGNCVWNSSKDSMELLAICSMEYY